MPLHNPVNDAFLGQEYLYMDMNMGAATLRSGVTDPDMIPLNGGDIYVAAFHGASPTPVEQVFGYIELNHNWQEGTPIQPHLHWMPTTTDTGIVKWQLSYTFGYDGVVIPAGDTIVVLGEADGTAWKSHDAYFPLIDTTGLKIETQLNFRLFRNAGDSEDTYETDAAVQTIGFHVRINSLGSRQIGAK